jgi:hypothetical protein
VGNNSVEAREVKCFNPIAGGEGKKKNVQRGYKYLVLGRDKSYFVKKTKKKKPNKNHSDSPQKFLETDIIKMFEFWNDNTFVMFGWHFFFSNRQSAFLWILNVLPFSSTCSFIRKRQISYWGF